MKKKVIGYKSYHDYIGLNAVPGDSPPSHSLHTPPHPHPSTHLSLSVLRIDLQEGTVQKPLFSLLPLENGGEQSLEGLQGGLNLL